MILSLLGMLGGGIMRLLPEVLGLLNKLTDYKHELDMMDRQVALEDRRAAARMNELVAMGDINQQIELMRVQGIALESQMQKTGIWWVDALNFLVRPLTTYYFLVFYGLVKTAMVAVALRHTNSWDAIILCWSETDGAILSGILSFWFVGRVFDKKS